MLYPNDLTSELIMHMLFLSDDGFSNLLTSSKRGNFINKKMLTEISTFTLVELIIADPSLLKSPIIFDEKKLVSGYNSEEIRVFLPSIVRMAKR